MKRYLKESLVKSSFLRNIFTLIGGTAASQFLPLLALPVLSRIYSPEDFGVLALFTGIILILVPLFSGEYTQSILYAKKPEEAISLLGAANCVSLCALLITLILFIILSHTFNIFSYYFQSLPLAAGILPVSVYLQNLILALFNFYSRMGNFKIVSYGKISNAAATVSFSLLIGYFSHWTNGLIYGYLLGQITTVILILYHYKMLKYSITHFFNFPCIIVALIKYKEYPKLILPSSLLNVLINQAPIYILGYYYNNAVVGFFSRSRQVLSIPISQIALSIGDVFKREANQLYNSGQSVKSLYLKTGIWLTILSIPFLLIIFIFGPLLFKIAFGEEWRTAGEYSQILIFLFVLRFINTPLGSMYFIAEKYKEALSMNVLLLLIIVTSFFISKKIDSQINTVLISYTIGYSLSYLIGIFRSYLFAKLVPAKKQLA